MFCVEIFIIRSKSKNGNDSFFSISQSKSFFVIHTANMSQKLILYRDNVIPFNHNAVNISNQ